MAAHFVQSYNNNMWRYAAFEWPFVGHWIVQGLRKSQLELDYTNTLTRSTLGTVEVSFLFSAPARVPQALVALLLAYLRCHLSAAAFHMHM